MTARIYGQIPGFGMRENSPSRYLPRFGVSAGVKPLLATLSALLIWVLAASTVSADDSAKPGTVKPGPAFDSVDDMNRAAEGDAESVVRIGLIDVYADPDHPYLRSATIINRSHVGADRTPGVIRARSGDSHGTVSAATLLAAFRRLDPETPVEIYVVNPYWTKNKLQTVSDKNGESSDRVYVSQRQIANAYKWFAELGVRVVGTTFVGRDTKAMRVSTRIADQLGLVVFASAGNGDSSAAVFPAAYDNTIAVAGLNAYLATNRRTGKGRYVDFSASQLGVDDFGFTGTWGTSFSTTLVAGVGAYLAHDFDIRDRAEMREMLVKLAMDRGREGRDNSYGHGAISPQLVQQQLMDRQRMTRRGVLMAAHTWTWPVEASVEGTGSKSAQD